MSNYYGKVKNKRFIQNQGPYNRPGPSHSRNEFSNMNRPHGNLQRKSIPIQNQSEFIKPKHSAPVICSSFNDVDSSICNRNKTHSGSKNFMNRMATSVTGIFGRSWWPEWLKGWEGSQEMLDDDVQIDPSPQVTENETIPHGESFIFSQSTAGSNRSPFKLIYPEEGEISSTECSGHIDSFPRGSRDSDRPPDIPLLSGEPTFLLGHNEQPPVASTPAASSLLHPRRMQHDPREFSDGTLGLSPCIHPGQSTNGPLGGLEEEDLLAEDGFTEETLVSKRKRLREGVSDSAHPMENTSLYTSALEESQTRPNKKPRFTSDSLNTSIADTSLTQADTSLNDSSYSIFYPGKVMYGGAANYKRSKIQQPKSMVPCKVPLRSSPAPSSTSSDGSLSQAAQRILASLDSLSTPLTEAKRFQVNTRDHIGRSLAQARASLDTSRGTPLMTHLYKHRPRLRVEPGGPPVTKLLTPNKVKLKENLSRLFKLNKETDSSNIRCSEATKLNSLAIESRLQSPLPMSDPVESDLSNIPNRTRTTFVKSNSPEEKSKMGRLKSFSCMSEEEMLPEPQKPSIGLQLSSMPKIVFSTSSSSIPSCSIGKSSMKSTFVTSVNNSNTENETSVSVESIPKTPSSVNFKSSVVCTAPIENVQSPQMNFKFSSPLAVDVGNSHRELNVEGSGAFSFSPPLQEVKSGGAVDNREAGGESDLKKKLGDWARKQESTVSEPKQEEKSSSWGAAFLPAKGTWECDTCMVRNKSSDISCISCMTPKAVPKDLVVSSQAKPEFGNTINVDINANKPLSFTQTFQGFGTKFMPTEGEWNCETCLLRNKSNSTKCASCETVKKSNTDSPKAIIKSGFDAKFLPSKGEWECEVCMVRNKPEVNECISCATPMKGSSNAQVPPTISESEFGSFKPTSFGNTSAKSINSGFKFGVDNDSSLAPTLPTSNFSFGRSKTTLEGKKTKEFSFGMDKTSTTADETKGFSFGIDKTSTTADETRGFSFGIDKTSTTADKTKGFSFGIDKTSPSTYLEVNKTKEFSFGVDKTSSTTALDGDKTKGFSFGIDKTSTTASDGDKTKIFSFGNEKTSKSTLNISAPKNEESSPTVAKPFQFGMVSSPVVSKSVDPVSPSIPSLSTSIVPASSKVDVKLSNSAQTIVLDNKLDEVSSKSKLFSFGDVQNTKGEEIISKAPMFTFGNTSVSASSVLPSATSSTFTFGATKSDPPPIVNEVQPLKLDDAFAPPARAPISTQVAKHDAKIKDEFPKPIFTFGNSQNSPKSLFSSTAAPSFSWTQRKEPILDKATEQKASGGIPSNKAIFSFGQSMTNESPSASAFGNIDSANAKSPFSTTVAESDKKPAFVFGQEKAKSMFVFGQKEPDNGRTFSFNKQDQPSKPVFSFGQKDPSKEANLPSTFGDKKVGFSFGSKDTTENPGVFGFGKPLTSPGNEATSIFGSKPEVKTDSSPFGQTAAAPVGGFSSSPFGGTQIPAFSMPATNSPASPVFAFGNKAPEKPADKGFNFGQAPPSFNFGSPVPTNGQTPFQFGQTSRQPPPNAQQSVFGSAMPSNPFSCTPTAASQSRVVKKAVRRTKK